jgi:hypothetical protein
MTDTDPIMTALATQAGFLAAHAIWCVSDGGPLIPFVGFELESGKQNLVRFVDEERLERAVERARAHFLANTEGALFATLIYDGYITLPGGKTDALFLESRVYCEPPLLLAMAVPYRNAESPDGFAVYRPKFQNVSIPDAISGPDYDAFGKAFFMGVDRHEKGADVWNRCMDQGR